MTPAQAEAAREAAWQAYDAIVRTPPDCEHVREWRRQVTTAREAHLDAAAAYDKAQQAAGNETQR